MKHLFALIIFSVFLLMLNSCGTKYDSYTNDFSGSKYFPLDTGYIWTYKVDSVIYDNKGNNIDTFSHIVKEYIPKTFKDNAGNTVYIIERYIKSGDNWEIRDTWNAYIENTNAIRNEENLKFIKLVFPIEENDTWDGNEYFDAENTIVRIAGEPIKVYQNWSYHYTSVDKTDVIGDITYDNVTTVVQVDNETSISKRYSVEKYAKDFGLIYKKMIILNTQKIDEVNTPWEEKAEEGFILTQKLLSFSKN